ncbi:MAG: phosphotransferase family protein [Myxococcales bacterium]|nr:phosphotransferase family protein [Myxococcales bacterium]
MAELPPEVPEVAPVREGEALDWDRAESWIRERLPELEGEFSVGQFPGGHANLTYLIRFGDRELVLRRPPFGPVAPGAHDMVREHKVLSKLWEHLSTAPRAYLLCEDESVVGSSFFVMERRTGVVVRTRMPDEMRHHADVERRVSFALIDAMADFHDVDFEAAGLSDLGKPEGFVERQVSGWKRRWDRAKNVDIPLFDELHGRLERSMPTPGKPSLVHNDLKLDNCQFDPADPDRVKSIFDWDMTTLGEPLADLGTLLGYWAQADDGDDRSPTNALTSQPGYPSRQELAERYAERRGVDLSSIRWYEAFAIWKTAVVLQQIYIRWVKGQTQDARFEALGTRVPMLVSLASETLGS